MNVGYLTKLPACAGVAEQLIWQWQMPRAEVKPQMHDPTKLRIRVEHSPRCKVLRTTTYAPPLGHAPVNHMDARP